MGIFKKIIAGGLGWTLGGPIGAIIGVMMASLFDSNKNVDYQTIDDKDYRRSNSTRPDDFQVVLLILMAAVVKADGKVVKASHPGHSSLLITSELEAEKGSNGIELNKAKYGIGHTFDMLCGNTSYKTKIYDIQVLN